MASTTAIIVSYNQVRFLSQALDSVAAQTRPPDEIIIVDDASTDGSVGVIERWARTSVPRPILRLHHRNTGPTRSFNEALRLASCEYVAPLAADDLWEPNKLAREIAWLDAADPSVCAVYGDVPVIDENGVIVLESFLDQHGAPKPRPSGQLLEALLDGNFIPGPSVLMRRQHAVAVGLVDESLHHEDYDFWLRLAARYNVGYIEAPTGAYRMLQTSLVRRIGREMLEDDVISLAKLAAMRVEPRRKILRRLKETALDTYRRGTPGSRKALHLWLRNDHSPTALAIRVLTLSGLLPWHVIEPMDALRQAVLATRRPTG